MYGSWDMVRDRQMDGQMDGKSEIEVGTPPKKNQYFEQSATLFGMKKKEKRIVNQILLSKIWYLGQIYTITKFIKKEIEKTIVQLSIWKCRLDFLDIDTQLNSLELHWI